MFAVMGLLAALLEARRSGRGQVVDAAMVDGVQALLAPLHGMVSAGQWVLERGANLLDTGAPFYDVYRTKDGGYLAIGALEDEFFAVVADRLALPAGLVERRWDRSVWTELRAVIEARIEGQTRDHWEMVFAGTDGCVAPVLDLREAATDPHQVARGGTVPLGPARQPAPAPRFSATPGRRPSPPPTGTTALGEVVAEWAGITLA